MRVHTFLALSAAAFLLLGSGHPAPRSHGLPPPFLVEASPWADSVNASLSLDEQIAQLMMVAAYSNKGAKHEKEINALIKERNIGGLIFFQGGPARQAALTNHYQAIAKTPLLVGMDLEWGLAMRLDSSMRFPKQMTLGALNNDTLIERMGFEIARQMKRLGVHVSFSPVADVNNNPANPVINERSFGEDRENVARKAIAYMRGLQNGGVIATAKHFPGHGDTDVDSHLGLPLIAHTRARLDSLELYPFQRLVDEGLAAMMVAHLEVPALDTTHGMPSTLSWPVNQLLSNELGFKGLVFTDALNMQGVANADKPGEIELRALQAGNDVLLFPQDPVKAIERIRLAVDSGEIERSVISARCLKVLRAKEWAGLKRRTFVPVKNIGSELSTPAARQLRRELYGGALTVLRNKRALPIMGLDTLRIASLVIGADSGSTFQQALSRYAAVDMFRCAKDAKPDSTRALVRQLNEYDVVIASIHKTSFRAEKDFGIPDAALDLLREIASTTKTIYVHFANPYRLTRAYGAQNFDGLVVAYEDDADAHDLAAQLLFGAIGANGKLPVTASSFFANGDGLDMKPQQLLAYGLPEAIGLKTADLQGIGAIVREGIKAQAFPGCQVVVAVEGEVVMNEAYGHTTYAGTRAVQTNDIYDLASITKVAATTLAGMKLVDDGRIELDKTLGDYLPELVARSPLHARMGLRDLLTHQSGLAPFVPFYRKLMKDGKLKPGIMSDNADATHTVMVADSLWMLTSYTDSLWTWLLNAPVGPRGEYVYSDMGYYLLQRVVEKRSAQSLDEYVAQEFYRPLGCGTLGFTPLKYFPKERIMPTEYDLDFRGRQVWGTVHDPGSAMVGGVAGHAGLFGSANDLAIILQMLLNGGSYNGVRYLKETTVQEFTKCQFCKPGTGPLPGDANRRGLGWDKPTRPGVQGPTCECVSMASFGHTGFTGTMLWADPETKSLYVFLSNRVHPNANNKKLAEMNIRTRIQEVVNDAIAARSAAASVGAKTERSVPATRVTPQAK